MNNVVATDAHSELAEVRIELNGRIWDDGDVIHMRDLGAGTHRLSVTAEDGPSNTTMVWVEFEAGDPYHPVADAPEADASGCRCVAGGPDDDLQGPIVGLLLTALVLGPAMRRRGSTRR
jgi:hypothetical protein